MRMKMEGRFHVEHWRDGKLIGIHKFKNGISTAGYNLLLNTFFLAAAQIATWYCGIIDSAGFTGLASTDTMASHPGWAESVAYSEAVRQTFTPSTATIQIIANPVQMVFTINATKTILGMFITSSNTKSGATGTLWSSGLFVTPVPVQAGDSLKVNYSLQGS